MKIINFADERSLVNVFMRELRDEKIQKDMLRFRRNIERIGEIAAYEISKTLEFKTIDTKTCLGTAKSHVVDETVVIATILRAGLPLHQGVHNYFDGAENAFVSAYRKYVSKDDFRIHIEYIAAPRIDDKVLIITDPMLANMIVDGACLRGAADKRQTFEGAYRVGNRLATGYRLYPRQISRRHHSVGGCHRRRSQRAQIHRAWTRRCRRPRVR